MTRRFIIGKEITWGGQIPDGWRISWYEPRRRVAVYFPTPLNWVARFARDVYWRFRLALHAQSQERFEACEMQRVFRERQVLAEEYARGYLEGWHECFDAWSQAMSSDSDQQAGREN
jgi:hypothetical protein